MTHQILMAHTWVNKAVQSDSIEASRLVRAANTHFGGSKVIGLLWILHQFPQMSILSCQELITYGLVDFTTNHSECFQHMIDIGLGNRSMKLLKEDSNRISFTLSLYGFYRYAETNPKVCALLNAYNDYVMSI